MNGATYRSLLVPLDGTEISAQALPYAAYLCQQLEATLTLVHVHTPVIPMAAGDGGISVEWTLTVDQQRLQAEQQYLEQVRQQLQETWQINPTIMVLDEGLRSIADTICDYAATHQHDLIVMTTHARGALARIWLGSIADACIRKSHLPVLLIPPSATPLPTPIRFENLLVPLDGSRLSETILEAAPALCRALGATMTLLHVIEPVSDILASLEPELLEMSTDDYRDQARCYLYELAESLRETGLQVQTDVVIDEHAEQVILTSASAQPASLIAMSTHGRSGFQRMLLGSVANSVLRRASTPLLIYQPAQRAEAVAASAAHEAQLIAHPSA